MKSAKILICIALSFSFLLVGVGFAQVTATLDFTGNVNFQHTRLYISNIASVNGVDITGYSGTTMNLTAVAGATMTITVTNPMGEIYYYHDYFAGNHTLTTDMKVGASVAPDGSITFTVTFDGAIANAQIVQFSFLTIPPSLEEPGTGGGNTSNAINALKLIIGEKGDTGKDAIGLNKENNDKTFEAWCTQSNPIIHCLDTNTGGKNLSKIFAASGAADVYFTLEWVSSTKYIVYLYSAKDAISANEYKYIVTYKQEILYNDIEKLWYASTENTFKGYAMVRPANHEYGVEVENNKVKWYSEPPSGAEVVE